MLPSVDTFRGERIPFSVGDAQDPKQCDPWEACTRIFRQALGQGAIRAFEEAIGRYPR